MPPDVYRYVQLRTLWSCPMTSLEYMLKAYNQLTIMNIKGR